jgi:hypothetical protein
MVQRSPLILLVEDDLSLRDSLVQFLNDHGHRTLSRSVSVKPLSAIIFKDVIIELRNKEAISSMMMFGLLVLVIFNFAFRDAREPWSSDR